MSPGAPHLIGHTNELTGYKRNITWMTNRSMANCLQYTCSRLIFYSSDQCSLKVYKISSIIIQLIKLNTHSKILYGYHRHMVFTRVLKTFPLNYFCTCWKTDNERIHVQMIGFGKHHSNLLVFADQTWTWALPKALHSFITIFFNLFARLPFIGYNENIYTTIALSSQRWEILFKPLTKSYMSFKTFHASRSTYFNIETSWTQI